LAGLARVPKGTRTAGTRRGDSNARSRRTEAKSRLVPCGLGMNSAGIVVE
jgi:hypothetical protein